jgi:hypothetical protein
MKIEKKKKISSFRHLELLANQIVEGFISGMHSPFHGFSAEFAEHKVYNVVKAPHIDWKLFAGRIACIQSV